MAKKKPKIGTKQISVYEMLCLYARTPSKTRSNAPTINDTPLSGIKTPKRKNSHLKNDFNKKTKTKKWKKNSKN